MKEENEYLENFDKIFNTKTRENINLNMPLLKTIFGNFMDTIYAPTNNYKELKSEKSELSDKLQASFTDKQRQIFNKYIELENEMISEEELQIFMFGYIISSELKNEVKQNSILKEE